MPRTFVIGDIHGESEALDRLMMRLPDLEHDDTLIFIGDYLDRGPDPRGVVERVRLIQRFSPAKVVALRGNHEDKWIQCFDDPDLGFLLPVGNGCGSTYRSYIRGAALKPGEAVMGDEFVKMLDVKSWLPRDDWEWMKTLELWYRTITAEELLAALPAARRKMLVKRIEKEQAKSRGEELFPKLAEHREGVPVIKDLLPTIFHTEENPPGRVQQSFRDAFAVYRGTLHHSYQSLLDRYELRDAAIKVVDVGSVGTTCMVLLLTAGDDDPLFLQIKEARASVLEPYAGASAFSNHGQRVVNGYRLMQPASDMFLGWSRGPRRDFFIRQLRDMKLGPLVETFGKAEFSIYAYFCGRALALAHARSGSASVLSGYMGKSDVFDTAIAAFSFDYADQNEKDHAALMKAIKAGRVEARFEEDR